MNPLLDTLPDLPVLVVPTAAVTPALLVACALGFSGRDVGRDVANADHKRLGALLAKFQHSQTHESLHALLAELGRVLVRRCG